MIWPFKNQIRDQTPEVEPSNHLQDSDPNILECLWILIPSCLMSIASIALVEYLFQRAHTQCICTPTKSTTTQPPVWAMMTWSATRSSVIFFRKNRVMAAFLPAKVGRLYHGVIPFPVKNEVLSCAIQNIEYSWCAPYDFTKTLLILVSEKLIEPNLNHLLDFGS